MCIRDSNIGGLGTLIASMASLISFKYIAKENRNLSGKYLGIFTASNIIFMIFMLISVSYTHLDVSKRQGLYDSGCFSSFLFIF